MYLPIVQCASLALGGANLPRKINSRDAIADCTSHFSLLGLLTFLQEVIACHAAGVPFVTSKRAPAYAHALAALKIDAKAVKMFIYGFFVSAPLNHYMMGTLQKIFAGKTSRGAKLGQLFAANFVVAPISTFGTSMLISCLHIHVVFVDTDRGPFISFRS